MSEEIIINGVNVIGCRFLDEWEHCDICNKLCDSKCLIVKDIECKTYDDCHYKKLKRLEHKYNEVLKLAKDNADSNEYCIQELEKENEIITMENQEAREIVAELEHENKKLKKENEELKKQIDLDAECIANYMKNATNLKKENENFKNLTKELEHTSVVYFAKISELEKENEELKNDR